MALESFGSETARQIDLAVKLCHDLLLDSKPEEVNESFAVGNPGIWKVYAGYSSDKIGQKIVHIELGVG